MIHWGADWLGATLATHFVWRSPSVARAGAYWPLPAAAKAEEAAALTTGMRRSSGDSQLPGIA